MAPLVVPNAALVRLVWGSASSPLAVNVLGSRKVGAGAIDQATANTLSTAIKARFTASGYAALVPNTLGLISVGIRDISQPNLPEFVGAGGITLGTQAAGKVLPPQVSLCITLRTALAGKSFRGRVFLPVWGDSALAADGTAVAAATTAGVSFINGVSTDMVASGLNLAVVSRKQLAATVLVSGGVQSRNAVWETIRGRAVPGI